MKTHHKTKSFQVAVVLHNDAVKPKDERILKFTFNYMLNAVTGLPRPAQRDERQGLDLIQPKVHQLILGPRSRYIVTTQTQP